MLEFPVLRIERWRPAQEAVPPRDCWYRAIFDPRSGQRAGVALWLEGVPLRWLRMFWLPCFSVHESDDEPLLFTVQRTWTPWPRWEVRDADQHRVGAIAMPWVLDAYDRQIARVERSGDGECMRFRAQQGEEWALLEGRDDKQLSFGYPVAAEPFLKMLLLAAALAQK